MNFSQCDDEDLSCANLSSIDSCCISEVSSLSGNSGELRDRSSASFNNHDIYGRDEERRVLESAYERMRSESKSEVILLEGESGTGKTFLVEKFQHSVECHFIAGRFDRAVSRIPFSAFIAALSDLCDLLIQEKNNAVEDLNFNDGDSNCLQYRLSKAMEGAAINFLTMHVSNFGLLMGTKCDLQICSEWEAYAGERYLEDLKKFSIQFLTSITNFHQPLCMFLDDIHQADTASIQLIKDIIQEEGLKSLLVICSFDPKDNFTKTFEDLITSSPSHVTKISTRNLDLQGVNQILSDILRKEESAVWSLSEVALTKTHGNVCVDIHMWFTLVILFLTHQNQHSHFF
jgi:AAA ATPase domain